MLSINSSRGNIVLTNHLTSFLLENLEDEFNTVAPKVLLMAFNGDHVFISDTHKGLEAVMPDGEIDLIQINIAESGTDGTTGISKEYAEKFMHYLTQKLPCDKEIPYTGIITVLDAAVLDPDFPLEEGCRVVAFSHRLSSSAERQSLEAFNGMCSDIYGENYKLVTPELRDAFTKLLGVNSHLLDIRILTEFAKIITYEYENSSAIKCFSFPDELYDIQPELTIAPISVEEYELAKEDVFAFLGRITDPNIGDYSDGETDSIQLRLKFMQCFSK